MGTILAGGLVRFVLCYVDGAEVDYYARGVGWTSRSAAQSSWTSAECREVDAADREIDALVQGSR